MLFNMGYCENHRVFTRHSSHRRSLRNFGFNDKEVSELTAYRYDKDDSQRHLGHSHLKWAAPCAAYKDDCLTCQETYQAVKSADGARRAALFADAVLSRSEDGDRLFMVSLPVPSVAIRSDRVEDYHRHRLGSYARLRKKKIKASASAFERKCKHMREVEGLEPHPRYFQSRAIRQRKHALSGWLSANKDSYYQLDCWRDGIIQSVVVSRNRFIRRDKVTKGWRYVDVDGRVPADTSAEVVKGSVSRMQPPLLRHCLKQFEKRMRDICDFKFIAVMERGKNGMYHYHMLLHVFGHIPDDLQAQLRKAWFQVTGNIHFEDSDGGSWFSPVRSGSQAAAYVSKYLSKGWFSRRQTSKFLGLTEAARDSRLIEYGFLQADIADGWHRHRDGFLSYESPHSQDAIEQAGTREWVGLSVDMLAPGRNPRFATLSPVAVFRSSSPCRHPAAAISGIAYSAEGERLDTIPQAWWFPLEALSALSFRTALSAGAATFACPAVLKLHELFRKIRFSAISHAHGAVYAPATSVDRLDGSHHDAAADGLQSLFTGGRFPLALQIERMKAALTEFPDTVAGLFSSGPSSVEDAALAHEYSRVSRDSDSVHHRAAVLRRRARAP